MDVLRDRHGRQVHLDNEDNRFVYISGEGGYTQYITTCHDAQATVSEGVVCCSVCYEEVNPTLINPPPELES